jgi:hypothetical protein
MTSFHHSPSPSPTTIYAWRGNKSGHPKDETEVPRATTCASNKHSRCSHRHVKSVLTTFYTELCRRGLLTHSKPSSLIIAFIIKPKAAQPSSSDVPSDSKRVSDRIKAQRKQLNKQVKPLAPKAAPKGTAEGKKAPRPKKPAPTKSKRLVQNKETKPRPSQVPRIQNIQEKALQELERRIADDPLPQDLATVSRISKLSFNFC